MNNLIFIAIYFAICNKFQLTSFINALMNPKKVNSIQDTRIINIIKRKTGLIVNKITIFNSDKPFGLMPGIPWKPEMILSSNVYETFNKDELEWIILHEAAHCVLWHTLKFALAQALLCFIGIYIISQIHSLPITVFLAVSLALCFVQIAKYFEYKADEYSISKVENPLGVISAQAKFKSKYADKKGHYSETSFARRFLSWNIPLSQRIEMAAKLMKKD